MRLYEEPQLEVVIFTTGDDIVTLSLGADNDADDEIGGGGWAEP